jgi:hypothetical protein
LVFLTGHRARQPRAGDAGRRLSPKMRSVSRRASHLAILRDVRHLDDNWLPPDNFKRCRRRSLHRGHRRRISVLLARRNRATSAGSALSICSIG